MNHFIVWLLSVVALALLCGLETHFLLEKSSNPQKGFCLVIVTFAITFQLIGILVMNTHRAIDKYKKGKNV